MMSAKKTPRHLIQDYADNVDTEKSIHPARRRRPLSRSPEVGSISQSTVSSTTHEPTRSGTKRRRSAEEEELTPRHLIQGVLDTQDTAKPSTRKSKKVGELLPPSSSKVKKSRRRSSLGVPTLEKMVNQFTPRSMITGFLEQGVEETPEQRAAKGDKSTSRSSFGDLPNNEISFHPIEASFHGKKFAKETKKTKSDRSRAAIHIVKRRSEKLARGAGDEIDFSEEEESDDTDEQNREGDGDHSRRKSGLQSDHDIDDTSAKDTSSVDPSPRKSLSRRRATPSKHESIASLKNTSHLTPDKSLSVSAGHLSPRETTPSRRSSKSQLSQLGSPRRTVTGSPESVTPNKSRSRSSHARRASDADAVEDDHDDDHDDEHDDEHEEKADDNDDDRDNDEMGETSGDVSVKSRRSMSMSKSRLGEIADESDLKPSPRRKSRSRGHDHTPKKEDRSRISSKNVSNSRIAEESASSLRGDSPSKSRSRLEVTSPGSRSRSRSKSRSRSRSRLPDQTDEDGSHVGDDNDEDDDDDEHDDEHSSLVATPGGAVDEPRSGRSSPRYSTGLTHNVYDFHDDSPSKRIIGKLAKTLQRSGGENIADADIRDNDDIEAPHYENMSDSDDEDDEHYGDEPEESIIPTTDKEIRTYYTPLRTPYLKEKPTSKPVSMVTSTPKPPTQANKKKPAKPKGKQKSPVTLKKKDTGYLPASVVKGLFTHFCPNKVAKETIAEVEKASAQFWENAAKDLESYALHAHRKTIEESDVELLMKRQKFITPKESLPALVEKYLPLELRQEIIPICRSGNKLELK